MFISKCLSYFYNNYKNYNKNDDFYNTKNQNSCRNYKDIDSKEDKWMRFPKKEGMCAECFKFSYLLSIIDKDSKDAICYRCFIDYRN